MDRLDPPLIGRPAAGSPIHIPAAPHGFIAWLGRTRESAVAQWVDRASRLGPHYRARSTEELTHTISRSYDVNRQAMRIGSAAPLDPFVEYITSLRLRAGFSLSEVQQAFDLYRILILPLLMARPRPFDILRALQSVNAAVSYQIHSFSDQFQRMHDQAMRLHAEGLEREVAKRSEELAASEHRYKTLVEEINDGYFAVQEGRVALANLAFCRMHGAAWEQTVSRPFLDFVAPEDREGMRRVFDDAGARGRAGGVLEYSRLGVGGLRNPTEIRARMVDLGQGPAIIGICRDITERVEMERKVRENERMAYVGSLTASLSHEIRNPLATIKMNLQILERNLDLAGHDKERMEITVSEVTRLEGILRQLLDVAKPIALHPTREDLNQVASGCLDLLSDQLSDRGFRLRRNLDQSVAAIRVDRNMIEQALINLLLNAMEACVEDGFITLATRAATVAGRAGCRISVRDNGPGLGMEERKKAFTPFFTQKTHGTGLGLCNVKRIVEAHGGKVRLRSSPGQGAKFILEIPSQP